MKFGRKIDQTTIVHGDAIFGVEPGTILKVTSLEVADVEKTIVMRTDSKETPLISLHDGGLWGEKLESYTFMVLKPYDNYEFILK